MSDPWDLRALASFPVEIDTASIAEHLTLSPDARLDRMQRVVRLLARRGGLIATDVRRALHVLVTARVDFVVIGGLAMVLHGAARVTEDLDICYGRDPANLARLVAALGPLQPRLKGAPREMVLPW